MDNIASTAIPHNGTHGPEVAVPVSSVQCRKYYVGGVPKKYADMYELLGIKFVHILDADGNSYSVMREYLAEIVDSLKLAH